MGTIQNSVNQTLGTIAGAALGAKHIKGQTESLEQAKLADKLSAIEKAEGIELQTQEEVARFNELNQEDIKLEEEATGLRSSLSDKQLRTSKGQFYSEKALKEMQDKIDEIRLQKMNQESRIKLLDEKRDIIGKLGVKL